MPTWHAGKQMIHFLIDNMIDVILKSLNYELFIKLTNLHFLHESQFGKPWNNVMLNSFYVVNNNE